jgi:hypothetical protein
MDLCFLLDAFPQITWSTGSRLRLETGETAYRFPITVLSTYTPSIAPEEE